MVESALPVFSAQQFKNNYVIRKEIGSGNFGRVYSAYSKLKHEFYAIKVFPESNLKGESDIPRFQREIDAMAYFKSDNIVSLHDFFWDNENFYLVMDYCPEGDLHQYISKNGKMDEPLAAVIFEKILCAVAYCHSYSIAHRDLKPENILISDFPKIKVSDFSLCGLISDTKLMETFCGSPYYVAPECLSKVKYDGRLSDVWSLGVVLFAMVTGERLWDTKNSVTMINQILQAKYELPEYLSPQCKNIINSMLKVNPNDRASLQNLLDDPWLKFSKWSNVKSSSSLEMQLSKLRLQNPMTLDKISSVGSRRSHASDHGIISPFESSDNESNIEEPINLSSLKNSFHMKTLSSSLTKIETSDKKIRRYVPSSSLSSSKPKIVIPRVKTLFSPIKEIE